MRIFTPVLELPFAGHPTLGTCHAWLTLGGGAPKRDDVIVQECAAGLIPVRRTEDGLAFAAPPLRRSGPVDEELVVSDRVDPRHRPRERSATRSGSTTGPGWVAVMLASADAVLAVEPGFSELDLGVVGPHPAGSPEAFEVRAFFPKDGVAVEDPVTGSLNASLAQWLLGSGQATAPYIARQGTALGRSGRVHITTDAEGAIWVGGGTIACITGTVDI